MRISSVMALWATALIVRGAEEAGGPIVLTDETFAHWIQFIRPRPDEGHWQKIPWRAAFWEAVV